MEFEENTMLLSLDPSGIDICGNEKITIASEGLVKVFNESKSTSIKSNGIEISGADKIKITDTGIDICDNFAISYNELSYLDGITSNIQQQINNNSIATASATRLGGIKVGNNLSITNDGILSSNISSNDVLNANGVLITGNQNINGNKNFLEKVGIGAPNSTTSQLYVNSSNTALHITQPDNTIKDSIKFHKNNVDYYGGIGFNGGLNLTTPNSSFPISFATNNTERLKIGGTGNIGINQTNPSYTLDVNGDLNFTGTIKKNGADFFGGFWSTNSDKLYYNTDNVGIGTDNPATKLSVQGPTALGTKETSALQYGDGDGSQYLFANANHGGILSSSGNGLYMQQSSGNVNIGGTNFNEKLSVEGNAVVSGSVKVNGNKEVATKEYVDGQFTTTNANVTTNTNTINSKGLWDKNGNKIYYNTDNIGIGTNNPSSKLEVVGDISASGVVKSNGGKTVATQDYVDGKIETLVGDPNLDTALDTLKEIADAINGDANFGTMVQTKFNSIDASFVATENATATNTTNIANNTSNITSNISDIVELKNQVNILNKTVDSFNVTVASKTTSHPYHGQGSNSGYYLNGIESPELRFKVGSTYTFTVTDSTNNGHPFHFYLDAAKNTEYTTNVTGSGSTSVTIQITETTPSKLYYQCDNHEYMGNCISVGLERNDVTQQEVGHLSGVSSNIQSQLDGIVSSQWTTNASNEIHFAENVGINITDPTEKLDVGGNIKASGNIQAHTINASNYNVGSRNVISASAQGSFTDLELKNGSTHKILGHGDTGNIEMAGVLQVDTINEHTSASGVTIDNVLIKDGIVNGQVNTTGTVTATNYNVGSINIVSATAQGTFRDLEVKHNGHTGLLVFGETGNATVSGVLNAKGNIGVSFENPTTKISLGNDNYDPNNVKDKMIAFHDNNLDGHYYSIGMAGDTTNDAGVGIWSKVEPTKSNPAMFVKNDGKVGVGNVAPTEKIDVTGNIKASGTVIVGTEPTNSNHAATKNYVDGKVAELVDTAPESLNTLNELAAALNDTDNFGTVMNNKFSGVDSSINDLRTSITNSLIHNTVTLYRPGEMRVSHDKANVKEFTWFREDDEREEGSTQIAPSITDDNPVLGSETRWWYGDGFYATSPSPTVFSDASPSLYIGNGSTIVDGVTKPGVWFQWEFFEKVKATRFRISTTGALLSNYGYDGCPSHITIAGSNDGTTWYSTNNEEVMTVSDYDGGTTTIAGVSNRKISKFAERNLDPSKIASYNFYRLIIRGRLDDTNSANTADDGSARRMFIGEFELIGSVVFDSNDASLNHITDVDTLSSPPTNGQALVWDNAASMWKPGDVTNTNVISDLDDVNTSGATNGQSLIWNGSSWVPGNTTSTINDLTDVNTSGATNGQALIWNGSAWAPGLGGAFSKNGNNAYYNDGNVGIGTTMPGSKLTVAGAGEFTISDSNNSSVVSPLPVLSLGRPGVTGSSYNNNASFCIGRWQDPSDSARTSLSINLAHGNSSNPMDSTHGKEVMFLRSDGNVGISNSNPSQALDVNGIILGGNARIGDATMNSNYASYGHKSLTGNNQYALIQTNAGSTMLNASSGQILDFRVDNDVKMTITANGYVGIGTTSPEKFFHAKGDGRFDGLIKSAYATDNNYQVFMKMVNTNYAEIQTIRQGVGYNQNLSLQHAGGNVGIGNTAPTEKLDVTGNIKASGSIEGNTIKVSSLDNTSNHNKVLMINSSGEIDICNNVTSTGSGGGGGGSAWSKGSNNKLYYNAGNIGIGTSDPSEKLQVNGKILAASMKFTSLVADTNTGSSTAVWEGSGNDVILLSSGNVGIGTTNPSAKLDVNGGIQIGGHILPSSNAQYDIGSAEYKIRHLFLSDNSLWIGDQHKVSIADGKIKLRKRKVNQVPNSIVSGGGNFTSAKTFFNNHGIGNFSNESEVKLQHWLEYAKTLDIAGKGVGNAEIGDLYNNNLNDFDEDIDAGYVLPAATDSALGGVKQGSGVTIAADGTISAASQIWSESGGNISRLSGNVGIGTTNPSCPLNVKSNDNEPIAKFEGDSDTIVLIQSNSTNGGDEVGIAIKGDSAKEEYWFVGTEDVNNNDNSLHFAASNSVHIDNDHTKMTLSREGNLGIGSTNPDSLLHIFNAPSSANTTNRTMLTIESDAENDCNINNFNPISIDFVMGDNNDPKGIARIGSLMCPTGSNTSSLEGEASTALTFSTQNTTSLGERMRITHDGNVGIGTTAPGAKLDVKGSIYINEANDAREYGLQLARGGMTGQLHGSMIINSRPNDNDEGTLFQINDSTKMFLSRTGNVGIGTTSPSEKLTVGGSIITKANNSSIVIGNSSGSTVTANSLRLHYTTPTQNAYIDYNNTANGLHIRANEATVLFCGATGNVGIGTTSPNEKLHVHDSGSSSSLLISNGSSGDQPKEGIRLTSYSTSSGNGHGAIEFIENHINNGPMDYGFAMGYAGSGAIPSNYAWQNNHFCISRFQANTNGILALKIARTSSNIYAQAKVYSTGFTLHSDSRIKTDISNIDDTIALQQVNAIENKEYNYIDQERKLPMKTIGFIAQQVKEVLPNAVTLETGWIPDEMRKIENPVWIDCSYNTIRYESKTTYTETVSYEEGPLLDGSGNPVLDQSGNQIIDPSAVQIVDPSGIEHIDPSGIVIEEWHPQWKLQIPDLDINNDNCTGNVRFSVDDNIAGNNISNIDVTCEKDASGNNTNIFILKEKYPYVFIWGKEVNDFHYLDKNQIFSLHHSAIQELSRKNDALKNENNELRSRLEALESAVLALQNPN